MVSRRRIALLAGVVVIVAVVLSSTVLGATPPTLTVENNGDRPYQITSYTSERIEQATYLNFRASTENGERELVTLSQLVWPDGYQNITLVDEGIPTQQVTVDPGDEVTTTIDGWTRGNVTVYIVERVGPDGTVTHAYTWTETCRKPQQEHTITVGDDAGTSSTCAGGLL